MKRWLVGFSLFLMHFSSIFYLTVLLGSHTYLILLTDRNHRTIWRTAVFLRYIPWRNIAGVPPNTAASVNTQPIHVSHSYSVEFRRRHNRKLESRHSKNPDILLWKTVSRARNHDEIKLT